MAEGGLPTAGFADVAQLVEHSLGKGEVISSILIIGSRVEAVKMPQCCKWVQALLRGPRGGSKKKAESRRLKADSWFKGGSNSVVESQPSKLLVAGSIPVSRSRVLVQV